MDPLVLERIAADWARLLVGTAFRGLSAEPAGVRAFFGPPQGQRGPTWALVARWPEPLWLWVEEAQLPKERERVGELLRYDGLAVTSVAPPAFDRRVRVNLGDDHARAFFEVEAWAPGNAIFVEDRRGVAWVAKRRAPSTQRPGLAPGMAYFDPPAQFRKDPRRATAEEIAETLGADFASLEPQVLEARLAHHWCGVPTPLLANLRLALASSNGDADTAARALANWAELAYGGDGPVIALQWTDKHRGATLVSARLPYVPDRGVTVAGPWPRWDDAARGLAPALPAAVTSEELADAKARVRRFERALRAVEQDWEEANRAPQVRREAEALAASLTRVPRGVAQVEVPDPRDPSIKLRLELDPKLPPHENANRAFRRATKLERALEAIPARRVVLIDELVKARAQLERLEAGDRPADLPASLPTRGAISPAKPARAALGPSATRGAEVPARLQPRRYKTADGWEIWVGKTNEGNDYLTHRLARPEDYWFHVQGSPGSHVVLRRGKSKDEPSRDTLREVASWAAFFSRQKTSGTVPVLWTRKKYVRKPRGSKPGLAEVMRDEKTIFVRPTEPPASAAVAEEGEAES
ncbi:MAG TPA: NFACT RNA binding domain-containing protein [Candidatus Eisenbacteria bacterium]|nr:NFACT RNA binding domain-containing protein [Candidatus Eisenbacteria bacterium]